MKILITGANGMVGKNISENPFFKKQDLLLPPKKEVNLLNYTEISDYIRVNSPELIIHCAGKVGGILANMADPVGFLVDNFDMGRNIVLASREHGVERLINMGSSSMYPRNINECLSEDMILKGEFESTNEAYAISKIATAKLCEYVSNSSENLNYKTIIPCNLYGRNDKFSENESHMIPAVIKKIHEAKVQNHENVEIWGSGTARREFMYAGELADFCQFAVKNYDRMPSLLNVGLGYDYTINEYYEIISKVIGFKGGFIHNLEKPVGMNRKIVSTEKLENFGWKSKSGLDEGIILTYEYYLKEVLG